MTASHDGSASAFESQLVAQVVDSLAMHMMDNARFMAERLNAEFPREVRLDEHVFLEVKAAYLTVTTCRVMLTFWECAIIGAIRPTRHTRSCEVRKCSSLSCER